ncbi:uncharacterized protein IUM83_11579 [Phytophthora cinnamomi]|uniref:uncharacterized protein n=1 Tax=Phytophthora cinnamomi TaxID=4785 RepID=UPI003559E0F6|nr:hypothetical protein IUM83_11579 [Phytophthora cinnamomi]
MASSSCPARRSSFSLDEKRRVLEHLRATGRVRETIARFYPQLPAEAYDARRRLVLSWRRKAREILAGASTRQGAARRRMRKPKAPTPQPPRPRGLAGAQELQDEPIPTQNGQELPDFEPIVLQRGRPRKEETHFERQDETQNSGRDQNLGKVDQIQDKEQDREQDQEDQEGGIQDLIASAVEQSVAPEEEQVEAEDVEPRTGSGYGSDLGSGASADNAAETRTTTAAAAAAQRGTKRTSFSLDEKRRVLEHLAACKSVRETIEKFYPDLPPEDFNTRRRTIWRWRTCAEQIVAGCADDKASARKKIRPRGIVCQRGPKQVGPQDVVDRLLTSVKKSEQRALKRRSNAVLRPAPPVPGLLAERQIDALVFSALGLPPTTRFQPIQPAPASTASAAATAATAAATTATTATTAEASAGPTMHPLRRGEVAFAIRRR